MRPGPASLVTLVILDGWGLAAPGPGNAVELARTPVFDALSGRYPTTRLAAAGGAVGLPDGQMGNSEVGHLTIGSGRILFQDLVRVSKAVEDGSLHAIDALTGAFRRARERGGDVHLLGLVSRGGVHSHIDHLRALLELGSREGMGDRTWIHAFTDGRDVSPRAAARDLADLPSDRVSTLVGRYYAMDRDARWERTDRALGAMLDRAGAEAEDPIAAVEASYARGVTDEFLEPVVLTGRPALDPARDAAIFFNFRPDRGRQLSRRLLDRGVDLTTMTHYADDLGCPVAFAEQQVTDTLAQTLASAGLAQLHVAETEKYAHVTYFFNGGVEQEWPGETRILCPSPRDVAGYDERPAMSADEVATRFAAEIGKGYGFSVINFANPDMVGHTGVIPAVVEAVETVDRCLATVVEATQSVGGVCLVTADHGNAEMMLEPDGISPHTAHTTNPVPLIATIAGGRLRDGGELSDLAPTVLTLLGIHVPSAMTGRSLVVAEG
jgi:2,3-bisphosphoglycerate-independent phosphoglycerate mutase